MSSLQRRSAGGKPGRTSTPTKPAAPRVRFDAIPEPLPGLAQFVGWDYTFNPDKTNWGTGAKGAWDKPPLQVRTGRPASTTDPQT
jgi:hypothetical protein